jgi:ATP-dependent Clp protease, protease subunit
MSDYSGKSPETIHRDFDRNKWLFAEEAVEYGVADKILDRAPDIIKSASATNADDDEKIR